MLTLLPPELISDIIVWIFRADKRSIGAMSLVCKEWHDLMEQPFIWMSIAMEFHPNFFVDYQDKVSLFETMRLWNEPNEPAKEQGLMIDWKSRVTEWELVDEIMTVSVYFFQEPYERRLATADFVSEICRSCCVSIESLLELIPSPRSDLRVSAGIGIREKFAQICQAYPQYQNTIPAEEIPDEVLQLPPYEELSPTALSKLGLAKRTMCMNDSVEIIAEGFELIMMASQEGVDFVDIEFPPLFRTVMDYIILLLDDRASRVSYRGIECIEISKPLSIYFYDKLLTLKTHYNPAVAHKAENILKSLK